MSQTTREVGGEITRASKTINKDLPDIVKNTRASTKALAKLTEELNQFRKLAGGTDRPAEEGLSAYANGLLELIQKAGGKVGLKNPLGTGLLFDQAAEKWVELVRPQALALIFLAKNRSDYLNKLAGTYSIQVGDKQPRPLKEWIRENHPPSKVLK
jgi:hypothetical protein